MAYPTTAVAYKLSKPTIGFPVVDDTSTTQKLPLGTVASFTDSTSGEIECMYCKGVANTLAGDVVIIDSKGGTTARAVHTTAARGIVGVAMSANVASQYGWYAIQGVVPVSASATVVAAAPCFLITATAGMVDDDVVATDQVDGMIFQSTTTAGFAFALLSYPVAQGHG